MQEATAYIGLGSNVGDRMAYLRQAITILAETEGISVTAQSPVYQTEPVGYEAQEDFYNMVVKIVTTLRPVDLLDAVKNIESEMGRVEAVHKGPREIDLDILLYGDEVIDEYRLIIPHPRMLDREFALRPLYDIEPDLEIGPDRIPVADALSKVAGDKRVTRIENNAGSDEAVDG